MKILKEGERPKPIWVGLQIACEKCNTVYELEEEDLKANRMGCYEVIHWFWRNVTIHISSFCPHCERLNRNEIQK